MRTDRLRHGRLLAPFAVLLLLLTAVPAAFARGSFGGGGRAFGGGGFGGGGFGRLFGGSRPSFTPAPRPSFTPPPRPAFAPAPERVPVPVAATSPRPPFSPAPAPRPTATGGSFGRGGVAGSPASGRLSATVGGGGSFGRTGAAGRRTFTSIGSHPHAPPPPATTQYFGRPLAPAFAHSYYYGGRPVNVYFTGGYTDYSFGYYRQPYLGYFPWSPVFFYNPPVYTGNGYVSGGFSFVRFLIGIIFWIIVIAVIIRIVNHFRNQDRSGIGRTF